MNPLRRTAGPLIVGLAALTLAACASAPKPMPLAAPPHGPPPPPPPSERYAPAPPTGAVSQSEQGAPIPGSARDFTINAGDRIYFDLNEFTLRDDARPILDAQAAWLNRYPAVRVRIEGNCDELGTREYNFALGARRANAVREYLMSHGVSGGRIETVSYGKERPIDTGSSDESHAHNRNAHTAITEGAR